MTNYFLIYVALLSFITMIVYGIDKERAKRGLWRISERTLLTLSFLGGALGGLIAMQLFRHKTRHWYFYAANVLSIILHIAVAYLLHRASL